ncbi:MAG: hypothetical protein KAT62_02895 [Desulfuromonadales bacterium]|nr:hypothetical protein [Desulfuromonadales bacterium]
MVLFADADVNEIARLGRGFPWPKPSECPRCQQPLWWHGFVPAYFAPLADAIFIRRLRCSCCGAVHRLKPQGYWRYFRSCVADIQKTISDRSESGRWRADLPRGRQRQWWRRLRRRAVAVLGLAWSEDAVAAFTSLVALGFIPISTAFQCKNGSAAPPPYRSVSLQ